MKRIVEFVERHIGFTLLLLIIIINCIIYHRWLSFKIFNFSDWGYNFLSYYNDYLSASVWQTSIGFGNIDVTYWRLPINILFGLSSLLQIPQNFSEKILIFWPFIFVTAISSFLLTKHITKTHLGGVIGSLVYSLNTYFLSINTQGHLYLTVGYAFATLVLYLYISLHSKWSLAKALITGVVLCVVGAYDLRSLYICVAILILYSMLTLVLDKGYSFKTYIRRFSTPFIILFLLSLYWLLPMISASALLSNVQLNRQISFSEYYSLQHALTLHFPFWTGSIPAFGTFISIPWYFWFYPLFSILGYVKNRTNMHILFFAVLGCIGILLTKQLDIPFDNLYRFLYERIPGFNAFRESSKFYYLISLSYSVLIASFVVWLSSFVKQRSKNHFLRTIIILPIVILPLVNAIPLISGSISTLFIEKQMSQDAVIAEKFINKQNEKFRILWIHQNFRWNFASSKHPFLDAVSLIENEWKDHVPYVFTKKAIRGDILLSNLESEKLNYLLDQSSVKYVMILVNDYTSNDRISSVLGVDKREIENRLNNVPYLKKVEIGSEEILVYENSKYMPFVYDLPKTLSENSQVFLPKANFTPPYIEIIYNASASSEVVYATSYSPDWKLKPVPTNKLKYNKIDAVTVNNQRSTLGFNSFRINLNDYCTDKFIEAEVCTVQSNGDRAVRFQIFYAPQLQAIIGSAVGVTTIIFVGCYLAISRVQKVKHYEEA